MEDQIIGLVCIIGLFGFIGWVSIKSKNTGLFSFMTKRKWGTNPPGAKYGRKR